MPSTPERLFQMARAVARRVDSWANTITNVGTALGKNNFGFTLSTSEMLSLVDCENLYNFDGLAARIADAVPMNAMRGGFTVSTGDAAQESAIAARVDELGVSMLATRAWTWGRVYGGGALYLGIDDGLAADQPVDMERVRSLRWVVDVDRRDLYPMTWDSDPDSERFGQPETYRLTRMGGTASESVTVHHTRIVRFEGVTPTRRRRLLLQGWGESIYQRAFMEMQAARGAFASAGALLQESSQGVFKMKDLMGMMGSDEDDTIRRRLMLMDESRSIARSILLDADGESYERVEVGALTGVADVMDRMVLLLSGVTGIPVTILLGKSPAGLNATGESDIRAWYDTVASDREKHARAPIERVVRLILVSREGPTGGKEPPGWRVEFPSLWQPTPSEEEDLRGKVATRDVQYIQAGVLTAEEVALSRFRREGYSAETTVDLEVRRAVQEADSREAEPPEQGAEPAQDPVAAMDGHDAIRMDGGSGCAIVLTLPPGLGAGLALPGGTPADEMHVTLAFLGAADALAGRRWLLREVVHAWAKTQKAMDANLGGIGRFAGPEVDPVYVPVDCPDLSASRESLVRALHRALLSPSEVHGFTPHLTLAYVDKSAPTPAPLPLTPVTFSEVALWMGSEHESFRLGGV